MPLLERPEAEGRGASRLQFLIDAYERLRIGRSAALQGALKESRAVIRFYPE